MSVVVYPTPLRPRLLDPVRGAAMFSSALDIPDRWDSDNLPLEHFRLRPTTQGLHGPLPPTDDLAPRYLVDMYRDGLMEYGTTLEPSLRFNDPRRDRIIFTSSHTAQAHDYLQAFAVSLRALDYDGPVAAQISFDDLRGTSLGVRDFEFDGLRPIAENVVRGEIWRGELADLLHASGRIVKQVMDLVFIAAGALQGCWLIDAEGRLLRR